MKIVICLDEQNGYMFFGRRQSMDRELRKQLLLYLDGKKLWMSEYTKEQFTEEGNYVVDNEYEKNASDDDYCFIEDKGYSLEKCNEVVIFRWKRKYPFNKSFDEDLIKQGFRQETAGVFRGFSHEEILISVYKR